MLSTGRTAPRTTGLLSEKPATDLQDVLKEASIWIKNVTGKKVEPNNFRVDLENGIILCELIEKIKPGSVRRINRMNIAMAHLDNLKQFLNACEKFGLKDSQLFDVTDLQVQSTLRLKSGGIKHTTADRRLRNVCITIYWLGRKVANTPNYKGPQLNLDAFRELLDIPTNPSAVYLQGYEDTPTTSSPIPTNKSHKSDPPKQAIVKTTYPSPKVEIKTIEKKIQLTQSATPPPPPDPHVIDHPPPSPPKVNGISPAADDQITPDDLLASIQNAVDELLMDCDQSPHPMAPSKEKKPPEKVAPIDLLQRNERSYSSPSPTSMSTPSPSAQPLPLFLDIIIFCVPGVSLGLQLIGGADTAIPAQVEVVMPGKPAEASGLKAGDIIISIEGQDVTRLSHYQLIEFIKQSVGKGSLSLGVERSGEVPRSTQRSEEFSVSKEERIERERQQKEIAKMYGGKEVGGSQRSYSYSTGGNNAPIHEIQIEKTEQLLESTTDHDMANYAANNGDNQREDIVSKESDDNSTSNEDGTVSEDFDIEIGNDLHWELPLIQQQQTTAVNIETKTEVITGPSNTQERPPWTNDSPGPFESQDESLLTMESTVSRLEEELEALTSICSKKPPTPSSSQPHPPSSKPHPTTTRSAGGSAIITTGGGIGQILSSTVKSVTIEPEELMFSENIRYEMDDTNDDDDVVISDDELNESSTGSGWNDSSRVETESGHDDSWTGGLNDSDRGRTDSGSGRTDSGSGHSASGRGSRNEGASHRSTPIEGVNVAIYRKEEWKTYRQEADGREEELARTSPQNNVPARNDPTPTHDNEIDPFAPISMTTSDSSHLLSDVLSMHKTEFNAANHQQYRSTNNKSTYNSKPTSSHINPSSYRGAMSTQKSSTNSRYMPLNATPTTTDKYTSIPPRSQSMTTKQQSRPVVKQQSQPSFEAQDEIQEMHGIKVRAVQRTRWTPDTNRSQSVGQISLTQPQSPRSPVTQYPPMGGSSGGDQSTLNKKSSIYERRDVVLMEVRNRGWSQGQNSGGYRQDPKRPWSSQSRRNHNMCSHCRGPIYQGPMMAIPDKDLYFHQKCLVCVVCRSSVSMNYGRATVFLRHSLPHCTSCYSNDNGIKVTTC